MQKISTMRVNGNMIFKGHKLTIGLDLGDRFSFYCVLDEAGEIILEQKLPTTPEAIKDFWPVRGYHGWKRTLRRNLENHKSDKYSPTPSGS